MVVLYENKNQILNDSIDRIVVEVFNKRNVNDSAQTILMTGCSSLSGTTTVSIAMAIAIANTQRKVLLLDCDVRKSAKYKKLNENVEIGLADYLEDDSMTNLNSVVKETNIDNLYYLPCGSCDNNPTRVLCSSKMNEVIKVAREEFDVVILDVPSISIVPDASILFSEVDGIILLAAIGETTKRQIKQAKRKIKKYSNKYYGLIVNKVDHREYKRALRGYDYYLEDSKGEQNLRKRISKAIKIK